MSDIGRWIPEPPDLGRFRFRPGDDAGPFAHLSDRELFDHARELASRIPADERAAIEAQVRREAMERGR
jgi:hypothetical protein